MSDPAEVAKAEAKQKKASRARTNSISQRGQGTIPAGLLEQLRAP
jgi:hypothetical protein